MRNPATDPNVQIRLLNGALDGDLTPDERDLFDATLRSDEQFAEQYDQLLAMQTMFSAADRFEAPPSLKQRIMDALPAEADMAEPNRSTTPIRLRRQSLLDVITSIILPRPVLALATALVVGFVGGAALLSLFGDADIDPGTTVGTVGTAPVTAPGVFTLKHGDIVATVEVSAESSAALDSAAGLELQLVRDGEVVDRRHIDAVKVTPSR